MKRKCKKLTALLLAVLCLVTAAAPICAAATDTPEDDPVLEEYTGMLSLSCGLSVSGGTATCTGAVQLKSGYTAVVSVTLQRSKTNGNFTNWFTWVGGKRVEQTKTLDSGYYYRVKVNAKIYDSGSGIVDNVTKYSSVKYY